MDVDRHEEEERGKWTAGCGEWDRTVMVWRTDKQKGGGKELTALVLLRSPHLAPIKPPHNAMMGSITGLAGAAKLHRPLLLKSCV